ncbi:MAG: MarR family transcriptional regulator [Sphingomonadales bacterium]|nr:MarR family transcriptional regulator [Sphingomonadales bacterium]
MPPVSDSSDLRQQARRLISTANSLLATARELEAIAERSSVPRREDLPFFAARRDQPELGEVALQSYRDRRRRNVIFGDDSLFGEPAWDILLDLFVAAKQRKRVAITSACIGAAVPNTTALRWLTVLEAKKLVVREADANDARRMFVRLSADAYCKMVEFLAA